MHYRKKLISFYFRSLSLFKILLILLNITWLPSYNLLYFFSILAFSFMYNLKCKLALCEYSFFVKQRGK